MEWIGPLCSRPILRIQDRYLVLLPSFDSAVSISGRRDANRVTSAWGRVKPNVNESRRALIAWVSALILQFLVRVRVAVNRECHEFKAVKHLVLLCLSAYFNKFSKEIILDLGKLFGFSPELLYLFL